MTFSASSMKENELHETNSQQSFEALPLKENIGARD
jgi:hypothetical protein